MQLRASAAGALPPSGLVFAGKAMLASPFLFSAVTKVLDFQAAIGEVRGLTGLEPAALFAVLVILTQLVGGLALLTRGRTAIAGGLVLAAFTVVATVFGHQFWSRPGTQFVREATTFLEHAGLVAGLVLIPWLANGKRQEYHDGG